MSKKRIEIEEAENGYQITTWGFKSEKEKDDDEIRDMYESSQKFVAEDSESAMKIIKDKFDKM